LKDENFKTKFLENPNIFTDYQVYKNMF